MDTLHVQSSTNTSMLTIIFVKTHSNGQRHGVPHGDPNPQVEDGIHTLHPHLVEQPAVEVVLQEWELLANLGGLLPQA